MPLGQGRHLGQHVFAVVASVGTVVGVAVPDVPAARQEIQVGQARGIGRGDDHEAARPQDAGNLRHGPVGAEQQVLHDLAEEHAVERLVGIGEGVLLDVEVAEGELDGLSVDLGHVRERPHASQLLPEVVGQLEVEVEAPLHERGQDVGVGAQLEDAVDALRLEPREDPQHGLHPLPAVGEVALVLRAVAEDALEPEHVGLLVAGIAGELRAVGAE
jgi:hypothetical protein